VNQAPPYLVPTNAGSVEHFFHFLLGYLCPISDWMDRSGRREARVRDCGPMNPWFDLLRPEAEIEVVLAATMLRQVIQHRSRCVVLPQLDNVALFERDVIQSFAARIRRGAGPSTEQQAGTVVVDRASSDPYYASPLSEVRTSGNERRSVTNMHEVSAALQSSGECRLLDAALLTPRAQVHAFSAAQVLVGQHGAGLANMVWMAPGSIVVEILPPVSPVVAEIFPRLAAACGHRYASVRQRDLHGPVSVEEVLAAVAAAGDSFPATRSGRKFAGPRRAATRARLHLRRQFVIDWIVERKRR
jgi:hypothetical protein